MLDQQLLPVLQGLPDPVPAPVGLYKYIIYYISRGSVADSNLKDPT